MLIYKLFSYLLSQVGPLGPHLEPSLCYWIYSLRVIKLHSKILYKTDFLQIWLFSFTTSTSTNMQCGKWWWLSCCSLLPPVQGILAEGDVQWWCRLPDEGVGVGRGFEGRRPQDWELPLAKKCLCKHYYVSIPPFQPFNPREAPSPTPSPPL